MGGNGAKAAEKKGKRAQNPARLRVYIADRSITLVARPEYPRAARGLRKLTRLTERNRA